MPVPERRRAACRWSPRRRPSPSRAPGCPGGRCRSPVITKGASSSLGAVAHLLGAALRADEARAVHAAPSRAPPRSGCAPRSARCRRGSSRPPAAACRGRRARPGWRRPTSSSSQSAAAVSGATRISTPSSPGVAGAADQRVAGPEVHVRGAVARRQLALGHRPDDLARPSVPGRRASRSRRGVSLTSASKSAGVLAQPGQVAVVVGGVGDRQVALVGEPVGEEVVEHAAVLAAEARVLGAADLELGDVVGQQPLQQRPRRRAPRSRPRPCARRRRRRTPSRTAWCSAAIPSYCTGISQPAKSTSFAPASTCASYSGVRLSSPRPPANASRPSRAIPAAECAAARCSRVAPSTGPRPSPGMTRAAYGRTPAGGPGLLEEVRNVDLGVADPQVASVSRSARCGRRSRSRSRRGRASRTRAHRARARAG